MSTFSDTVPQRAPGNTWHLRLGERLLIDIQVAYPPAGPHKREYTEQYAIELGPHPRASTLLQVHTWSQGRRSTITVDRGTLAPPATRNDWCCTAIDTVLIALYGELHPAPRLLGSIEWTDARLSVAHSINSVSDTLRDYELRVISSSAGWWRVHEGSWCQLHRRVALCREDADPVYALTRLARQSEPEVALAAGADTLLHRPEGVAPPEPSAR